jgi:hypothetical protein
MLIMIFYALRRRYLQLIRHADRMGAARNSYRNMLEYLLKNKREMALMKLELRLSRWCPILPPLSADFLHGFLLCLVDGGDIFLRII